MKLCGRQPLNLEIRKMLNTTTKPEQNRVAADCPNERLVMRNAAIKKIRTQFGDTPEHKLMFAIVEQAIKDLNSRVICDRKSAEQYLKNEIPHAELCGVDSEWVRRVLKKCGTDLGA